MDRSCKSGPAFWVKLGLKIDKMSDLIYVFALCFRLVGAINNFAILNDEFV